MKRKMWRYLEVCDDQECENVLLVHASVKSLPLIGSRLGWRVGKAGLSHCSRASDSQASVLIHSSISLFFPWWSFLTFSSFFSLSFLALHLFIHVMSSFSFCPTVCFFFFNLSIHFISFSPMPYPY